MAKKKKAPKAKAKVRRATTPEEAAEHIVDSAEDGVKGGLFDAKKHFSQDVYDVHVPKLIAQIKRVIEGTPTRPGRPFDDAAKKGTKIVAKDIGKVCRMLTNGDEISEDLFDAVRVFVKDNHWACQATTTLGGGDWCDY